MSLVLVGRHGGGDLETKLVEGIRRMDKLSKHVSDFSPDVLISFCSPEAARIAFGLQIKHVSFTDSPHAEAVMRLTLPLVWKLFTPWIIHAREFAKFGISAKDVIHYKAIDAALTIKRKAVDDGRPLPFRKKNIPNILVRLDEEHAAYATKSMLATRIVQRLVREFGENTNIVVLARYPDQARNLKKVISDQIVHMKNKKQGDYRVKIILMKYDGKLLLEKTDLFVGSGGTMTAESALMGVPTVSYGVFPNIVENFLAKKCLVKIESDPDRIAEHVRHVLRSDRTKSRKKAVSITDNMEDPTSRLIELLDNLH